MKLLIIDFLKQGIYQTEVQEMKIDLNKFAKIIAAMNDLENSIENQEYHELLGILSGNRTCLENITLEQLAYYIETSEI